ncbi:MAG: drug resistance transporter, EmrB/QacA subfamily [Streptosporangiaceae bacterium]|nr:drug resistance transporter, EmrB/QacA subfamily [Streptosporangiaceae bacterium]
MDPQPSSQGSGSGVHNRRWYILGVLVVSLLVVVLDNTVLNVALKTIADPKEGLGATQSQLEWAINSYTLVFAGLLFTFGVIGDRIGRKRMLIIGMLLFGLSSLVSSYATSPDQLIWARAAMGLGGAAIMPQTLSIISNVFEPRERGKAIGLWAGAVGIGIAIGPVTGGLLLDHFWWGSVFLINVPIIIAGVTGIVLMVPESRNPSPAKIDSLGVLLSIAGLVLVTYGIIEGGNKATWTAPSVLGPIVGGVLVLALFIWYESRIAHPALNVKLFRDPRLSASVGAITLVFFGMAGVFFFVSIYLQSVRDYSPLQAGLLTLPFAAAQLIFSPRSAGMVQRFGAKATTTTGLIVVLLAIISYQFLTVDSPIWVLEVGFFLQGAGMANVMPPATNAVMSVLPREEAGSGSALTNVSRQVAVALGVAVLGSVVSSIYRDEMTPHLTGLPKVAGDSIGATTGIADKLHLPADRLVDFGHTAFVDGMHVASGISAVITLMGVLVVLKWMPGRAKADAADAAAARQRETADV